MLKNIDKSIAYGQLCMPPHNFTTQSQPITWWRMMCLTRGMINMYIGISRFDDFQDTSLLNAWYVDNLVCHFNHKQQITTRHGEDVDMSTTTWHYICMPHITHIQRFHMSKGIILGDTCHIRGIPTLSMVASSWHHLLNLWDA